MTRHIHGILLPLALWAAVLGPSCYSDEQWLNEAVVTLAPMQVTASPYMSPVDSTVLKTPVTVHETPRSVSVIDANRIRDQDFQTLDQTFRYVPGIFSFAANNDSYHFVSRGFDMGADDTKLDGFTGYLVGGSFSPSLFAIDQVVYLRGPAGLLYGAAALPGGMINLVTKKPVPQTFTRIDVRYGTYAGLGVDAGSHASYEVSLDQNRPLTRDGRVAYRLAAEGENRGFYNDAILDRNRNVLLAMTWTFGVDDRFTLTPIFQYERQPLAAGRGLVISPSTSLSTADGRTGPINISDLTPVTNNLSSGDRRITRHIAGVDFTAAFSPQWHASASYRFMGVDSDTNQFTPQAATLVQLNPADPRSWVIQRRQAKSQTDRRNHAFDLQTRYEAVLASWLKNRTQLGFNGRFYRTTAARTTATQPNQSPVNIYTGVAATPLTDANPAWIDGFLNDDFYWNAYVQNQTSFAERGVLTLGAGYGEQHYGRNYPSTQVPPANLAQLTATRKGELTPNAALLYKLSPRLALYTSYATSYQPADSSFEDSAGRTGNFGPTTGENYETGFKYDLARDRASLAVSVFQTELSNVLVQSDATQLNPNGNRYYTQTGGGRRTEGLELSAEARPVVDWKINATASWLNARYHGEGRIAGSRVEKTPVIAFSLQNRYDFTRGRLKGLGASLGVMWQDEQWSAARTSAAPDPLMLPAWTRVDAGLFYRWGGHWDLALNCQNVFDRLYFVTGSTGSALEIGAPRTLSVRAGYRF